VTGHGGKRKGAGRKVVEPSLYERLAIGARCEAVRDAAAIAATQARADARVGARVKQIQLDIAAKRSERAASFRKFRDSKAPRAVLVALLNEFKRYEASAHLRIKKEITPTLDRAGRLVRGRLRAITRDEVQRKVAKEYKEAGRPEITARRIKAYWSEYGNFLKEIAAARET
jgi:hypothetical protein